MIFELLELSESYEAKEEVSANRDLVKILKKVDSLFFVRDKELPARKKYIWDNDNKVSANIEAGGAGYYFEINDSKNERKSYVTLQYKKRNPDASQRDGKYNDWDFLVLEFKWNSNKSYKFQIPFTAKSTDKFTSQNSTQSINWVVSPIQDLNRDTGSYSLNQISNLLNKEV